MKQLKKIVLSAAALLAVLPGAAQTVLPYQNPALSAEERANDLISRLTIEEKAKLMIDESSAIPRLGIKQFPWWNEALHGIGRNGFTTVFPITMGMAASFDDGLVYRCFDAASDEARVKYEQAKKSGEIKRYQGLSFWTPNINIFRDPRWGRGQETYGEDPYLTERMGLAVVNGLQGMKDGSLGDDAKGYYKLLACAKHFAVHSGPEWNRHTFNVEDLPERDLWETYLPAFKGLVQKGNVAEVMCAYQRIDGEPCCSQTRYLQQILRGEWGFKGIVVSDCGAIRDFYTTHNFTKTAEESIGKAVVAGTDNNCGSVYKNIPKAVKQGDVKESDIDISLKRLIMGRIMLGEMDDDNLVPWSKIPASVLCSKAHNDLAYRMAQESMVLLQNRGSVLPLQKSGQKIVVMGPNAADSVMQWGNYSGYPERTVTLLQGIQKKASQVKYISGAGLVNNRVPVSHFAEITSDGQQGMTAEYFNNTKLEGEPIATARYTAPIRLNNGGNTVFAPGVELENFSARYKGTFKPVADGKVSVKVEADDGLRLIINGDTLENRFRGGHGVQKRGRELNVKAGEEYAIQIDYIQTSGMAHMQFDVSHQEELTEQSLLSQVGDADVVVFCGGISPSLEGEEMKVDAKGFKGGDRTDIELPDAQRSMLKALHQSGKKVVYVNCSGSAIGLVPETETCDAILQAWYPGERGGDAVADVLFGDYNPSGKLPITFYRSVNDLPDFLDYTMKGKSADGKSQGRTYRYFTGQPLWPFGYGLSYTTFTKSKAKVKKDKTGCTVTLTVTNSGKMAGTETVMAYLTCPADKEGPVKTLRQFERVTLQPGEAKTVTMRLEGDQLLWWDKASNTMQPLSPKQYNVVIE